MKVINLYAGPSSGKSTGAAYLFSRLKMDFFNTELVTEYAKTCVYDQSINVLTNQVYVTGKQFKPLKDLQTYGVDVAVTDSPLLLGLFYGKDLPYFKEYSSLLVRLSQEFDNINVFVNRVKPYNPAGRLQTEAESDSISHFLKETIGFDYFINGDKAGYDLLYDSLTSGPLRAYKVR
jgi:hypothetical protein